MANTPDCNGGEPRGDNITDVENPVTLDANPSNWVRKVLMIRLFRLTNKCIRSYGQNHCAPLPVMVFQARKSVYLPSVGFFHNLRQKQEYNGVCGQELGISLEEQDAISFAFPEKLKAKKSSNHDKHRLILDARRSLASSRLISLQRRGADSQFDSKEERVLSPHDHFSEEMLRFLFLLEDVVREELNRRIEFHPLKDLKTSLELHIIAVCALGRSRDTQSNFTNRNLFHCTTHRYDAVHIRLHSFCRSAGEYSRRFSSPCNSVKSRSLNVAAMKSLRSILFPSRPCFFMEKRGK
ncbi:hypothetical protein TIFTF001_011938 [Ficus carica]|uniref:Uncharacterized protein n=1 Tax=Ficus carica TaxID=3494 RepID=A0AA88A1H0_FICCA|nr:hypothetical protein TIFTF001_011938 [Ficus carica]